MKKHPSGLSDFMLDVLWRKAVLRQRGYHCNICGCGGPVEAHHIVKRRVKLLRWDWRNGLPVCHECHDKHADLLAPTLIPEDTLAYLQGKRALTFKAYLFAERLSENEWRAQVKTELLAAAGGA